MAAFREVKSVRGSLVQLAQTLQGEGPALRRQGVNVEAVQCSLQQLIVTLEREFDLGRVRRQLSSQMLIKLLRGRVKRLKRYRKKAEDDLIAERALRVSNRIEPLWFVRAGLADPSIPMQTLRDIFFDFPIHAEQAISHTYISRVRDAFAEILKGLNRREAADMMFRSGLEIANDDSLVLYIQHIHDEASMRMRSFAPNAVEDMQFLAAGRPGLALE